MKRNLLTLVVGVCSLAACAEVSEVHWYHGGGGAFLDENHWDAGNWSWDSPGTIPGALNKACFYGKGSFGVDLSADHTIHSLKFGVTEDDLNVAFNLGGHTLTSQDDPAKGDDWTSGVDVNGDAGSGRSATVRFTNGTLVACYLKAGGDGGNSNSGLILDGVRFEGTRGDIVVGALVSYSNCVLEVVNGGYAEPKRSVVMGQYNQGEPAGYNTIRVSGEGSAIVAHSKGGDNSSLPLYGSHNQTIIENGGLYRNEVYWENPYWAQATYIGVYPGADHNAFIVRSGGRLEHPGEMRVGLSGSDNVLRVEGAGSVAAFSQSALTIGDTDDGHVDHPGVSNRLEVVDGGRVTLGTGNEIWAMVGRGVGSDCNAALVSGPGSYFGIDPELLGGEGHPMRLVSVGDFGGCSNTLTVTDGGTLAFDNIYVGGHRGSSYNTLNVVGEGSVLTNTAYDIFVGASDGANKGGHNNLLNVADGGYVYAPRNVFVGMADETLATSNTLRIFNGKWEQPTNYDIQLANRGTLVWGGSEATINTPWLHAGEGSELQFEFDENGIAPFTTRWEMFLAKTDGTLAIDRIVIDARKFVKAGGAGTFDLMKALGGHRARRPDGSELTEEEYARLNADFVARCVCLPSGLTVSADLGTGCHVKVKVPALGFRVFIR